MSNELLLKPNSIWKHKKTGSRYVVITIGTHTETEEVLVVYCAMSGVWIRPRDMFLDGRFEYIGQNDDPVGDEE